MVAKETCLHKPDEV